MLNKNENLAAVSRFIPRKNPAVIVVPLLDAPGIKAIHWASPTQIASFNVKSLFSLLNFPTLSASSSTSANAIKLMPITKGSFVISLSITFLTNNPTTTIGIVPAITKYPNLESILCSENFFLSLPKFSLTNAVGIALISLAK